MESVNRPWELLAISDFFAFGLVGMFLSLFGRMIAPRPSALAKALERQPTPFIAAHDKFWEVVNSVEGCALLFVIFASLAVLRRRNNSDAWMHAALAGAFLGQALFR
jgi:hypothetical protein